jgi:hypothetical protein
MSGKMLRAILDPREGRPSLAIAAAAGSAPLLVLTVRLLADLAAELGDHEAAARFLQRLVEDAGRPMDWRAS